MLAVVLVCLSIFYISHVVRRFPLLLLLVSSKGEVGWRGRGGVLGLNLYSWRLQAARIPPAPVPPVSCTYGPKSPASLPTCIHTYLLLNRKKTYLLFIDRSFIYLVAYVCHLAFSSWAVMVCCMCMLRCVLRLWSHLLVSHLDILIDSWRSVQSWLYIGCIINEAGTSRFSSAQGCQ